MRAQLTAITAALALLAVAAPAQAVLELVGEVGAKAQPLAETARPLAELAGAAAMPGATSLYAVGQAARRDATAAADGASGGVWTLWLPAEAAAWAALAGSPADCLTDASPCPAGPVHGAEDLVTHFVLVKETAEIAAYQTLDAAWEWGLPGLEHHVPGPTTAPAMYLATEVAPGQAGWLVGFAHARGDGAGATVCDAVGCEPVNEVVREGAVVVAHVLELSQGCLTMEMWYCPVPLPVWRTTLIIQVLVSNAVFLRQGAETVTFDAADGAPAAAAALPDAEPMEALAFSSGAAAMQLLQDGTGAAVNRAMDAADVAGDYKDYIVARGANEAAWVLARLDGIIADDVPLSTLCHTPVPFIVSGVIYVKEGGETIVVGAAHGAPDAAAQLPDPEPAGAVVVGAGTAAAGLAVTTLLEEQAALASFLNAVIEA